LPKLKTVVAIQKRKKEKHRQRLNLALNLRKRGLSYWRIGEEMGGLDRGYIRKLILKGVKSG